MGLKAKYLQDHHHSGRNYQCIGFCIGWSDPARPEQSRAVPPRPSLSLRQNHLRCKWFVLSAAKRIRNEEAGGSNPLSSIKFPIKMTVSKGRMWIRTADRPTVSSLLLCSSPCAESTVSSVETRAAGGILGVGHSVGRWPRPIPDWTLLFAIVAPFPTTRNHSPPVHMTRLFFWNRQNSIVCGTFIAVNDRA